MSATTFRCGVSAAVLAAFFTVCSAQTAPSGSGQAPPPARSGGPYPADGAFRPAGSVQAEQQQQQQQQSSQVPQQPSPVYTIGKEYRIGANDLLDVEVLNLDYGKRTVRVNALGYVTMPLVGPVMVAGLTQQQ